MEQTNTGTVAQMLEEGLAKINESQPAVAEVEVERQIELAVAEIVPSGDKVEVDAATSAIRHALANGATMEQAVETALATKALGADPAYFASGDYEQKADRIPVFPAAHGAPYAMAAQETVHPLAVEVSTKMQGLTAEEVLAGLMPELSALYRERDELLDTNARQQTASTFYMQELGRLHKAMDTSSEEVSFAYRAGQEVEKTLGQYHTDLVRLETNNQLLAQQAGVYKADLQVIHGMLMSLLMRNIKDKDVKAAEERANRYYQLTTLELAQEVVFASTSPEQFATNFGSRVAEMRKELEKQAVPMAVTDGGSNEQNSSAEGLLQGQ